MASEEDKLASKILKTPQLEDKNFSSQRCGPQETSKKNRFLLLTP